MLKLIAINAALFLAACMNDDLTSDPIEAPEPATQTELERQAPDLDDEDGRDICALLPTEGACQYACNPDKMMEFIPEHACAVIPCTLTDGTTYNTGGCNF